MTNPGAWYDEEQGRVLLPCRAAGGDAGHKVYFGLATREDGCHFMRQADLPVFGPGTDGFDAGCVEDPRIIKIGDWYYVTDASHPFPPGRYWENEAAEFQPPVCPEDFPWIMRENETATGLAAASSRKNR